MLGFGPAPKSHSAVVAAGGANEVLNERAVAVMKRMSDKLTGRDFLQVCWSCSLDHVPSGCHGV